MDVKVGDEVVYVGGQGGVIRVKVTRVGRTLFDVEINGRPHAFYLKDGYSNDSYRGGYRARCITVEEHAARLRYDDAERVLRAAGLSTQHRIDTDLMEKLAKVIREHRGGQQ